MSIANFLSAGVVFHNLGKLDVSLALICSAIDGTAKKVYPQGMNNNERNKNFIKKYLSTITIFGFPGIQASGIRIKCVNVPDLRKFVDKDGYVGIEDIIYCTLRCGLIHECEIDKRLEFTDNTIVGDFNQTFKIPKQLFWGLAMAVILCEQNKDEITEDEVNINLSGKWFTVNELWGKESSLKELLSNKT